MKLKSILLRGIAFVLAAVISYSAYQLWGINRNYIQEAEMHSRVQQYSPMLQVSAYSAPNILNNEPDGDSAVVNQSIMDLQAKYPDVAGWLTVLGTQIDHLFVQGDDNDYYLHIDLDRNWSQAGTIFMDYCNAKDFSDFNTIIFGHNMRNGSMFGTLQKFNDKSFFDSSTTGTIFLANKTYEIEFIAFAVVRSDDAVIYNPNILTELDRAAFLGYVRNIARRYRDVGVTTEDRIITLSTCNYEFNDARMVLVGRILP